MKGIIFSVFTEYVEDQFGLDVLDTLLEKAPLSSGTSFTSLATYPDSDLVALISTLSKYKNKSVNEILHEVGHFMIQVTARDYPIFFDGKDLKGFLKSVNTVIHEEVHKLFPNAETPTFAIEEKSNDLWVLVYHSNRKLCQLAEGLIAGAGDHFKTPVKISQSLCYHKGDDCCYIEVEFLHG